MKFKPGAGKWVFLALMAGTITGALCLLLEAPQAVSSSIPAAVSAGVVLRFRKKWLA